MTIIPKDALSGRLYPTGGLWQIWYNDYTKTIYKAYNGDVYKMAFNRRPCDFEQAKKHFLKTYTY